MFQVQAPVVVVPTTEARAALGVQLRPAARLNGLARSALKNRLLVSLRSRQ